MKTYFTHIILGIGIVIPFLADLVTQILVSGGGLDSLSIPAILTPENNTIFGYVFLPFQVSFVIALNMIPYMFLSWIIQSGDGNAFLMPLERVTSNVKHKYHINNDTSDSTNAISPLKGLSAPVVIAIAISLVIVIALNFLFHYGAWHSYYDPVAKSSSTTSLVFVVFPAYAMITNILVFVISYGFQWIAIIIKSKMA